MYLIIIIIHIVMSIESVVEAQNPWWRTDSPVFPARRFPVRRDVQPRVLAHLLKTDERRALLIHGPRQVGKTVLMLQTVEDLLGKGWPAANITYFDFSDDRLPAVPISPRQVAELNPAGLLKDRPRIFLFDEISRAERWSEWLKQAVDSGLGRFVVTDSAASLVRDQSRESGFGRWDEIPIEGLSFSEFLRFQRPGDSAQSVFELLPNATARYLAAGGFPEHARSEVFDEVRRRLRSDIVDRAIMRDLALLGGVDVVQARGFFIYLAQSSGSIFDAVSRSREVGADPRSIRNWCRLFEDAKLIVPLTRRSAYAAARLRSKPKIYAADHGIVAAFAPVANPLETPQVRGAIIEAVVFRHLREASYRLNGELAYFRSGERFEIDFVLDLPDGLIAVEVTGSADVIPKLSALAEAAKVAKANRVLLIHGGAERRNRDGIRTIPLPDFLLNTDGCLREGQTE
jgi:predicted AAA+ superfamily ATPase